MLILYVVSELIIHKGYLACQKFINDSFQHSAVSYQLNDTIIKLKADHDR